MFDRIISMIKKVKEIWRKYKLGLYASVIGSFLMGTIHLVSTCIHFSWITFNYMLFCYLLMFSKLLIWILSHKKRVKEAYLFGTLTLVLMLVPLGVSLVKTMTEKDTPIYLFDWFIYAYALYASTKLTFSIINLVKKKYFIVSWISFVGALFTLFMMEFALIKTFSKDNGVTLFPMMVLTQAVIIVINILILILFIVRFIKTKNKKENLVL